MDVQITFTEDEITLLSDVLRRLPEELAGIWKHNQLMWDLVRMKVEEAKQECWADDGQ